MNLNRILGLVCPAMLLTAGAVSGATPVDHAGRMKASAELFGRIIRPVFQEHCLKCHGGEKVRSDFNLATREQLLRGGENGPVLDMESPPDSRLLGILRHEEEPHMPPKSEKLDGSVVTAIGRWIELGAAYDRPLAEGDGPAKRELVVSESDRAFWSFRPLRPVPAPEARDEWAKTDIDLFVLAKLRDNGLSPGPAADERTWVRRVYLDLVGLPPTPGEMKQGLRMSRADLVDALLDSPHHGERWARHWLDAARFAESHGFEQDYDRKHAYHYRDFVIKAFNEDMPFDRFVRWQLAGDEFAPENPLAMMATGFLGAGVFPTQLTEKEFESARYDELDDMAATMGTAMLGLTIGCARCHDHKFDPIPVKDYYRLVSVFTTTIRSEIDLDLNPSGHTRAQEEWQRRHADLVADRQAREQDPQVLAVFDRWVKSNAAQAAEGGEWSVLSLTSRRAENGSTLTPQPDGSVLVSGKNPASETLVFETGGGVSGARFLRVEALSDESLPRNGPGRAGNGNFALSDFKVFAAPAADPEASWIEVRLKNARATHQQNPRNLSVASAIDDNPKGSGWAVDFGGIGRDQAAVFELDSPPDYRGGMRLQLRLSFANNRQHVIGRPRFSFSSDADPPVVVGGTRPATVTAALDAARTGTLTTAQRATLFPLFLQTDREWRKRDAAVRKALSEQPRPMLTTVQVTSEGYKPTKHHADGRGFPHFYPETHFLNRGDPNQKQGVATPSYLQVLMRNGRDATTWREEPPKDWRTSYRRRSLANWITDAEHGAGHLLARVIVNRVWHHHFGRGIVATPNDFGLQGAEPTHPDLLDFLAGQFIADGWKLKDLHRRILLSATFAQGSAPHPVKLARDPENRWLWRFEPRRLEAEIIRDAMLAVSGELDRTMFGAGTLDPAHRRRSIYFMIKRSKLVPMMQIFDQPEPLVSQGERPSTTIAPQALLFMNNPEVVRWSAAMARSINAPEAATAVREVYRRALGREPLAGELADGGTFITAQAASYAGEDARQLALADFCQAIFGLNEFVYLQ